MFLDKYTLFAIHFAGFDGRAIIIVRENNWQEAWSIIPFLNSSSQKPLKSSPQLTSGQATKKYLKKICHNIMLRCWAKRLFKLVYFFTLSLLKVQSITFVAPLSSSYCKRYRKYS